MNLPAQGPLLDEIGKGMLAATASSTWTNAELPLSGAGGLRDSGLSVTDQNGVIDRTRRIEDDTLDACMQLREAQQPGTGTWHNARLTVDRQGSLEVEFDYDNPPFDGDFEPELLVDDQSDFPRDQAQLPNWHPSKTSD